MSQNNPPTLHAGLEVAQDSLALDFQGRADALSHDAKGHARLLRLLSPGQNVHVVLEATGGYAQPAVRALHAAAIALSVVEPGRVRAFARALGRHAKTDPIDAAVLSAFGRAVAPPATTPPSATPARLGELVLRRRQLVEFTTAESNRSAHSTEARPRRQAAALLRTLRAQIAAGEKAIAALLAADEARGARAARLQEVPGVGATTAATLLAEPSGARQPKGGAFARRAAPEGAGKCPSWAASATKVPPPWPAWPPTTARAAHGRAPGASAADAPRCVARFTGRR